jgi:hypothetical protein
MKDINQREDQLALQDLMYRLRLARGPKESINTQQNHVYKVLGSLDSKVAHLMLHVHIPHFLSTFRLI